MNEAQVLDIARDAMYTMVITAAPVMLVGLVVGLIVALFQALTQIQEMTLSFVPKILSIFVALILFLPFMLSTLSSFTERMVDQIVAVE